MTVETGEKKRSNLFYRFAVGIPLGALACGLFAFGERSLLVFLIVGAWFALREFWRTTGVNHPETKFPLARLGDIAAAVLLFASFVWPQGSFAVLIAIIIPLFAIHQLVAWSRGAKEFIREVAVVTLGVLYIGGLLSFVFMLRHLQIILQARDIDPLIFSYTWFPWFHREDMIHLTLFPVLTGWCTDTAALFAGKYFGKIPMALKISPKKTVEGLIGGMVGAATGVTVYGYLIGLVGQVKVWEFITFGIIAAGISQLGDLTVSALKREAHQKDSGRLLGAHGGMLDRIDGFLFALPATYVFFLMVLN